MNEPHGTIVCKCIGVFGLSVGIAQAAVPDFPHYVWNNVTVGGGGFSPNIVFSPVEPGLAYLRTDIGGVYRYERSQQRWIALQDGMAEGNYFGVESVAPDPRNAQVVYAAVGMYSFGPAAILRSDDRGTTWNVFPVPFRMGGNEDGRGLGERLAIDPHDTNIVYFGSRHDGLQRSADRGRTWSRVTTFPAAGLGHPAPHQTHAGVSFVLFDPRSGPDHTPTSTLFVGVADPNQHHLFRSIDGGASWQPVSGEPRANLLPVRAQLASNGMLYLTYSNGAGPNGITDGAVFALDTSNSSWRDLTPPPIPPRPAGGFMGLAVDAQRPNTLLVATIDCWQHDTIWRSTDAGRHWESLRPRSEIDASASPFLRWGEAHADFGWWMAGVAIDPFNSNHIAYTTGATLYASDQPLPGAGAQRILWRPWVAGIEETAILALASPPLGPPLLSGFGDIGGFAHEDLHVSPPTLFTNPIFDNTDTLEFAGQAPNVVVRSGRPHHGNLPIAAWSQDFARSWTPLPLPPATERTALTSINGYHRDEAGAVAVSADGATFIAMTRVPMLTRDRGQHWVAVRGLPDFAGVVADRLDAGRFYALDFERSRIAVSDDGGQSFAFLASGGFLEQACAGQPARAEDPRPLLATPGRAADLWLVCHGRLYHSLDGGRSFTERRGDLAVTALAFGKSRADGDYPTLFAIGTRGDLEAIWRSDDVGASWLRINDAEHEYGRRFRVICADQRVFGRVYVGTDGRGVLYGEPSP
jgi:xyloglucan-specific exo-beta-1,4-glucanase